MRLQSMLGDGANALSTWLFLSSAELKQRALDQTITHSGKRGTISGRNGGTERSFAHLLL
ncbi:hypothetical protein XH90_19880 [Bradyrhizobium sp. CCBAU 53338]|nr:hypothetical protein XH90_19880 [Bradyrhizobium sp. CCBAU 53338]